MRKGRSPLTLILVGLAMATALQACGAAPDAKPSTSSPSSVVPHTTPTVLLDFEGDAPSGEASSFPGGGKIGGNAVVQAVDGGQVRVQTRKAGGHAVRFPAYDASQRSGAAVLVLQPAAGDTRLDPGDKDFMFGADFTLDRVSEGAGDDNGNNLVQRGLAADPRQFKLQIEHGRASCRVSGSQGEVVVKSRSEVEPDRWYAVTCARKAGEIALTLQLEGDPVERVSSQGATGAISYPEPIPLVVGGKVSPAGQVVSGNSDQFNGVVDNVFLDIG